MRFTKEESLMYTVMKAIYDSRIPIDFKGSMVLKACLLKAGYSEETRHTVDIDANWRGNVLPSAEQMTASIQKALDNSGLDLEVKLFRMYGNGRSAGFELNDRTTGEPLFSMDIDVNRPALPTQMYEIAGFRFRGVSPSQILADKVSVLSSEKVFRRIKDLVDLYYLSKVFPFDKADVMQTLNDSGRILGSFDSFLLRKEELRHAYEKFRFTGDVDKPQFDEVYDTVKTYIESIYSMEECLDLEP